MKIKNIIHFSLLNFRIFYKTSIKIILSLTVVIACMTLAYGYKNSIKNVQDEIIKQKISEAYFSSSEKIDEKYMDRIDCWMSFHKDVGAITDEFSMQLEDGERRKGVNKQDYYFLKKYSKYIDKEKYNSVIDLDVVNPEGVVFANSEIQEFNEKYPGEEIYLYQSEPFSEDTIMISDYMLKCYGFSDEEIRNICGKRISIIYNPTGGYTLKNAKVSAVINSNIFYTEAHNYRSQIVIGSTALYKDEQLPEYNCEWRYYLDSYGKAIELINEIESNEDTELHYNRATILLYNQLEEQKKITDSVILVVVWMITGIIVIGLSISVYFKCKYFQKNYATMYSLGCTKRGLFAIYEFEMLLELLIATGIAVALIRVGCYFFEDYVYSFFEIDISGGKLFGNFCFVLVMVFVVMVLLIYGFFSVATFSGEKALEKLNAE